MFLAPVSALSMGCAYYGLITLLKKTGKLNKYTHSVSVFIFIILLLPPLSKCLMYKPEPPFDINAVILSKTIERRVPKEAKLWNWWGPGYLFQYYGKRKTIIDGGSQEPYRSYITAVPLASPDPLLSRNWIKFFTEHENGLHEVKKYTKSYADAVHFLIRIFMNPEQLDAALLENNFPEKINWMRYFFPESDVYLVLLSDMLTRGSWLSIGRSIPGVTKDFTVPFFAMRYSQSVIDREKGEINFDGRSLPYGTLYSVSPSRLSHRPGQDSDRVAIAIENADRIYYVKQQFFDCLTFRLMFIYPSNTPYFKMLKYNPFVGGIWKIE